LKAVADRVEKSVKDTFDVFPKADGTAGSQWILLDYGSVIVHILTPDARARYQLESLWGDAPVISAVKTIEKLSRKKSE
jgi:ribosome-associated protein